MYDSLGSETKFRDGAQGFLAWALPVFVAGVVALATGAATLGMVAQATTGPNGSGLALSNGSGERQDANNTAAADPTMYYVDTLFRPAPGTAMAGAPPGPTVGQGAASAAGAAANLDEARAEARRILVHSIGQGELANDDRTYLAQRVAMATGLSPQDAQTRVTDVVNKARDDAKQAAETTAKAGAYVSFWTFMSLLFGAVAATLAGILGGELRDARPDALAGS